MAEIVEALAPLPTTVRDTDDTLPKHRTTIQQIADSLLDEGLAIPKVKAKEELLHEVASDIWRQDVTLQMLEEARRELRSIVHLLEGKKQVVVYTDFADTLDEVVEGEMPELVSGTNLERFNAKMCDYLQPDRLREPDHRAPDQAR